jgi:serine-type D-Ala-D-Ala carboxypeptidase/endopeptidase
MPTAVRALFTSALLALPLVAASPAPVAPLAHRHAVPVAAAPFPPDSAVLAIIRQRVEEKRSAGIVVGLLDPDGSRRVVAYGDPGPGQPPLDGNSVFEIGSISKVFTATVLADLAQQGKVRLDDPVQKYLPAGVRMPSRDGMQITLLNLSEQNSGLPRMPDNFHPADPSNPYADYTVQDLWDFLSHYTLTRDPGAQFEYSNLGVGLLGQALSRATGMSYETMERRIVWRPLGMEHTAVTFTPWMKAHLALGHDEEGQVVPNWDLPTLAGAGAIRSTTNDMLAFLAANLHPERGPLERAMAFAHEERASGGSPSMRIGLNWFSLNAGPDTIVWHNGGTGGYRTFVGFIASKKIGVVVMTNSGGTGADDIGFHLLDPVIPLAPRPEPEKPHTAIALPASAMAPFVGRYELAPTFMLDVTLDGDSLFVQATGQSRIRLWPESTTGFFVKEINAQIRFVRDSAGAVTALVLHQNGVDQTAKKIKE